MENDEIWKTYPQFYFIQGSSFGRVRTIDRYVQNSRGGLRLVKGHILPQQRDKHGYMAVDFSVNGKHIRKFVHQIVLGCFVNNPDNLPMINHKNCDPTDNRVENLEWCDASYNNQYREKNGKSQGHSLWAVDLETQKKLCFRSQNEAGRELGVNRRNIQSVLKGKQNTAGGFWFTEDESKITKERLQEIKNNMLFLGSVISINLKTSELLYFKSPMEAKQQLEACGLYAVLKGKRRQAKGYWFVYADKNAVEKARDKFGNHVANKVSKLIGEYKYD